MPTGPRSRCSQASSRKTRSGGSRRISSSPPSPPAPVPLQTTPTIPGCSPSWPSRPRGSSKRRRRCFWGSPTRSGKRRLLPRSSIGRRSGRSAATTTRSPMPPRWPRRSPRPRPSATGGCGSSSVTGLPPRRSTTSIGWRKPTSTPTTAPSGSSSPPIPPSGSPCRWSSRSRISSRITRGERRSRRGKPSTPARKPSRPGRASSTSTA